MFVGGERGLDRLADQVGRPGGRLEGTPGRRLGTPSRPRGPRDGEGLSFAQLGEFIAYKARKERVPVVHVNPAYTTRTCTQCGDIDKANRRCERALLSGRVRTVR
jgi:hypothetical protein